MVRAARVVVCGVGLAAGSWAMAQGAAPAPPVPPSGSPTSPPGPAAPAQPQTAAPAEAASPAQVPAPSARSVVFSIAARGELDFNTNFKDAGDVTVTRAGAIFGASIPAGDRGEVNAGFEYEYSNYDFSKDTELAPGIVGSPWKDINREEFSLRYSRQQTRQVGWFVGGSVGAAGEDGAKFSDSIFGSAFGGVRYALSKDLVVGIGVAARTEIEDNPLVVPLPMIDWKINEQWRLSTGGKPGLVLSYAPTEALTFSLGASYEYRDFRLDEHGPVPDGVGRETRVPIVLGVAYTPTKQIAMEAGVGYAVAQNYQVLNHGGNKLGDEDADPGALLQVRVSYRF